MKEFMENNSFEHHFSFSQKDVEMFSQITGDINPIHLDADYARGTLFKKPIMHGFLAGSVFSKIFGTLFPGEGTIYLKQEMKFLAPMFVDTEYVAKVQILEKVKEKKRAVVETMITDENGNITIKGDAVIQHEIFG